MLLHKRCSPTAGCIACIIEDIVNREFPSQILLPFNSLKKMQVVWIILQVLLYYCLQYCVLGVFCTSHSEFYIAQEQ